MKVQQPNGKIERIDSKDLKHLAQNNIIMPEKDKKMNEAAKALEKIKSYNNELLEIKDKEELDKINIPNHNFLFRPFKLSERVSDGGIILTIGKEKNLDRNSMKMKYEDLAFPYQTRGVVVKKPNSELKGYEFLEEGMVVNLPHNIFPRIPNYLYKIDKNNWEPEDNEKYLTMIIPVSMIETYENKTK